VCDCVHLCVRACDDNLWFMCLIYYTYVCFCDGHCLPVLCGGRTLLGILDDHLSQFATQPNRQQDGCGVVVLTKLPPSLESSIWVGGKQCHYQHLVYHRSCPALPERIICSQWTKGSSALHCHQDHTSISAQVISAALRYRLMPHSHHLLGPCNASWDLRWLPQPVCHSRQ